MATAADSLRVQLPGAVLLAPPHYQVIQGEEGQVLLQPPPPATAVIQITVMSAPPGADAPLPAEDLIRARAAQRGRPVQDLGDAKVITTYDESGDQEGRRVFVRFVEIGVQGRLAVIARGGPQRAGQQGGDGRFAGAGAEPRRRGGGCGEDGSRFNVAGGALARQRR
jgi:hypothetical protein